MKTTRLVRFLILRGCDKTIRDNNDKIAIELIQEIEDEGLRNDVSRMLGESNKLDCLMIGGTPNRLTHKNATTMMVYISGFMLCYVIQFLLVFPRIPVVMGAINTILTFLCLTFLSLVNCTDPGYVKNEVDFYDLIRVIESTQLCPDCETVRTSRSRHCAVCHRCVERFDHHCPWVNNCVGVKNHNYFLCYIATQLLIILVAFTGCLWALIVFSKNQYSYNEFFVSHLDSLLNE